MKKLIIFILVIIVVIVLYKKSDRQSPLAKAHVSEGQHLILNKVLTNESEAIKKVDDQQQEVPDFFDLEAYYKGLSTKDLKAELSQIEKKMESGAFIEKANSHQLTSKEISEFRTYLRSVTVIQKLVIERNLDAFDRTIYE